MHAPPRDADDAGSEVELKPGIKVRLAPVDLKLPPTAQAAQASQEHQLIEGLGQVVVGPGVERLDLIGGRGSSGDHQDADRPRLGVRAQGPQEGFSGDAREVPIQQHEVHRLMLQDVERPLRVLDEDGGEALAPEPSEKMNIKLTHPGVVLNDQSPLPFGHEHAEVWRRNALTASGKTMYTRQTKQTNHKANMPERTYTTHDIARFCDVSPSSVLHWIDGGKLRTYQTDGGHHRVTKEDLIAFLRSLNMRLPDELVARKRILIVDDDAELAKVIARAFSRFDEYEGETCGDGINALIRIGRQPPGLVILDVVIPKMDGIQVCRVLKSQPQTRDIKIIAISGKKLPFGEKKLVDIKVDAFFRKPLDLHALVEQAAALLRIRLTPRKSERAAR